MSEQIILYIRMLKFLRSGDLAKIILCTRGKVPVLEYSGPLPLSAMLLTGGALVLPPLCLRDFLHLSDLEICYQEG